VLTYSGLELGNLSLSFTGGECFSLFKSHSDLADFNFELFAKTFGVLVVLLFLVEFSSKSVDLSCKTVSALLGGSLGVEGIIEVALHGGDVSFQAAFVVAEDGDLELNFSEALGGLSKFSFGILASSLSLEMSFD
jgi:hypothetical protein